MGIFKKKDGSATKFTKAFAGKGGKQSVFSKVLNTALDVVEYVPVFGTVAKGVGVGVKAASKTAVKVAIKTAAKEVLKQAAPMAIQVAQANAASIRGEEAFNMPDISKMGEAEEQKAPAEKNNSIITMVIVALAVGGGWLLLRKK
jgi:LPXTG-motif cell wall-anchored protein